MTQLGQCLALYLTDALTGDAELTPNLLEGTGMTVGETETQFYNLALALGEPIEHLGQLLLKHAEAGGVRRHNRLAILYEVAELAVFLLAYWRFKETGSCDIFWISRTRLASMPIRSPISSGVGSRPSSCSSWR